MKAAGASPGARSGYAGKALLLLERVAEKLDDFSD
jgi:hypothetical protein